MLCDELALKARGMSPRCPVSGLTIWRVARLEPENFTKNKLKLN